jgi:hypothetical protein
VRSAIDPTSWAVKSCLCIRMQSCTALDTTDAVEPLETSLLHPQWHTSRHIIEHNESSPDRFYQAMSGQVSTSPVSDSLREGAEAQSSSAH